MGVFFIFVASMFWALDTLIRFPLVESGIPAVSVVFLEHCLLVLVFSIPLVKNYRKILNLTVIELFYFFMIGAVGSALATVAFTRSFEFVNPSLVILLQKLQPLVAMFLASWLLRERIQGPYLLFAALSVLGAVAIGFEDLYREYRSGGLSLGGLVNSRTMKGYGFIAVAIMGWGSATVFGRKLAGKFNEYELMSGRFFMAFIFLVPMVLERSPLRGVGAAQGIKIAVMVIVLALPGMFFYYRGLKRVPAKLATLAEMSYPLFAVLINWLAFGKSLSILQLAGGAVLLVCTTILQWRKY